MFGAGGAAYTGRALDFVRERIFGSNSTRALPTRNIVVLVTGGQSRDNAAHHALKLKRQGQCC